MGIKTNELPQVSGVTGADSLLVDTDAEGTGRLSFDRAAEIFRGEPGPAGPEGPQGPPGPQGEPGVPGITEEQVTEIQQTVDAAERLSTEAKNAADALAVSKQNKLAGQPGQVVGFDGMGLAHAVQSWSNPNLLDNWYFADPINRRGQTEYTGEGYTIDRWRHETSTVNISVAPGGLRLSGNWYENAHYISQPLEITPEKFRGKIVTGSMLVNGVLMSGTVQIRDDYDAWDFDIFALNEQIMFAIQMMSNGNLRFFIDYSEAAVQNNIVFNAAKLELGSRQTLAHQDADGNWVLNDPPDFALQYAKCAQYDLATGTWVGYPGVTMEEVSAAIDAAITGAIGEAY